MALTMVGTQAPQKLFSDFASSAQGIPGVTTPEITAAMPSMVDWDAVMAAQNAAKANRGDWARAAAINNARFAQANAGRNQEHYLPSTASQTSGMGYGQSPNNRGPVLWAPRNLEGPKLGTWASQQQNRAIAENREMPIVLQAHTGDPYSPGEVGGGASNVLGRGIFGPGLTSAMGGTNPYVWAKMWGAGGGGGGGSVGGTRQAGSLSPFPKESLRHRVSPGPQYQYDMFGGR
jgi:hypothetical protein